MKKKEEEEEKKKKKKEEGRGKGDEERGFVCKLSIIF